MKTIVMEIELDVDDSVDGIDAAKIEKTMAYYINEVKDARVNGFQYRNSMEEPK